MSDIEEGGKKSGYRLEYSGSARAKCKGASWRVGDASALALAANFLAKRELLSDIFVAFVWYRTQTVQW